MLSTKDILYLKTQVCWKSRIKKDIHASSTQRQLHTSDKTNTETESYYWRQWKTFYKDKGIDSPRSKMFINIDAPVYSRLSKHMKQNRTEERNRQVNKRAGNLEASSDGENKQKVKGNDDLNNVTDQLDRLDLCSTPVNNRKMHFPKCTRTRNILQDKCLRP